MNSPFAIFSLFLTLSCCISALTGFFPLGKMDRMDQLKPFVFLFYLGFGICAALVNAALLFSKGTEKEPPPRLLGCFGVLVGLAMCLILLLMAGIGGVG